MKCGIVDMGSNTIRLSVYRWEDGVLKLLLNRKEMVGLADYAADGALSQDGIRAAARTLAKFRQLLDNFEIPDMYVFATASLRNISNTDEAVADIAALTGLRVEVLSGAEEARLSFVGAALVSHSRSGLLADIGGGSTELVTYSGGVVQSGCSLPMGSLSLYARFVDGLFPTEAETSAITDYVAAQLQTSNSLGARCPHMIGVGGTIRAAAQLCGEGPQAETVTSAQVRGLYEHLRSGGKVALRRILRTTPDRVHTLLPGLAILCAVLDAYGVETITVSDYGVREGYLMEGVVKSGRSS